MPPELTELPRILYLWTEGHPHLALSMIALVVLRIVFKNWLTLGSSGLFRVFRWLTTPPVLDLRMMSPREISQATEKRMPAVCAIFALPAFLLECLPPIMLLEAIERRERPVRQCDVSEVRVTQQNDRVLARARLGALERRLFGSTNETSQDMAEFVRREMVDAGRLDKTSKSNA